MRDMRVFGAQRRVVAVCLWAGVAVALGCGGDTRVLPDAGVQPPDAGRTLVSGSATIGAAGGTVTAGDVQLEVPAGALAENVEIKINETRDAPPPAFDVSTRIVRFEPHGTAFATPVTVSFARPASGRPKIYWSRGYKSPYLPLVSRIEGERVKADVDHFSFGAWVDEGVSNASAGSTQDFLNNAQPVCGPSLPRCPLLNDCTNGKCEPRPPPAAPQACANSAECSAGRICINFFCVPPQCGNGVGCLPGFECDDGACKSQFAGNQCGSACSSDGDCRPGLSCFGERCLAHSLLPDYAGVTFVGATWYINWLATFEPLQSLAAAFVGVSGTTVESEAGLSETRDYLFQRITPHVPVGAVSGRVYVGAASTPYRAGGCAVYTESSVYVLPLPLDVSPKIVVPGTLVEVTGHTLEGARVAIETAPGAFEEADVVSSSYGHLVFRFPPGVGGGALHLRGPPAEGYPEGAAKTYNEHTFTLSPSIAFEPAYGGVGSTFMVSGRDLRDVRTILFGDRNPATFAFIDDTRLLVTVPQIAAGEYDVHAIFNDRRLSARFSVWPFPVAFTLPSITRLDPAQGRAGDVLAIEGTGLGTATGVTFAGAPSSPRPMANFHAIDDTRLLVTVPQDVGTGDVQVTTPSGTASAGFTVPQPGSAGPIVLAFEPTRASRGAYVRIEGRNLLGVSKVRFSVSDTFAGDEVRVDAINDNLIVARIPSLARDGFLEIERDGFEPFRTQTPLTIIESQRPVVERYAPDQGPSGTTVLVTGRDLDSVSAVVVDSSGVPFVAHSDRALTFTISGAPGLRDVVLNTAIGGVPVRVGAFTIAAGTVSSAAPVITGFYPASGPPGTLLRITGSNFLAPLGSPSYLRTYVWLNDQYVECGGSACAASLVHILVPQGATTGPIVIQWGGRAAISPVPFVVTGATTPTAAAPPFISRVEPGSGPIGTRVTLHGAHLRGVTAVLVGGEVASFASLGDERLTVVVPDTLLYGRTVEINVLTSAGSGTVPFDVVRLDPEISSASAYLATPGMVIQFSGRNLGGVTNVLFNGLAGGSRDTGGYEPADFHEVSDTSLLVIVPACARSGPVALVTRRGFYATSFSVRVLPSASACPTSELAVAVVGAGEVHGYYTPYSCTDSGSPCVWEYLTGDYDYVLPRAAAGFRFDHWEGACAGSLGCTVTMTAAQSLTAVFVPIPGFDLAVTTRGSGTVTSAPAGIDCGVTCTARFDEPTNVRLTAAPAPGFRFVRWESVPQNTTCPLLGPCDVAMTEARSVAAVFVPMGSRVLGPCTEPPSLQDIGERDFEITFDYQVSSTQLMGLVGQRAECFPSPSVMWDVRHSADVGARLELLDGVSYEAISARGVTTPGVQHSVAFRRAAGVLTTTLDGVAGPETVTSTSIINGALVPLRIGLPNGCPDGTQSLSGSVTNVCIRHESLAP